MSPLQRALHAKKALAKHRQVIDGSLAQADRAVENGVPGQESFSTFLNGISNAIPSDTQVGLNERLRIFHV